MQITMNDEQDVQRLEILCKQLYESQDITLRNEAESALIQFQESTNSLGKCQMLLERADSPYSQLLAATAVSKLVMRPNQCLDIQQRIDIRNYVLNYLANRMKLQHFVVQALVSLFTKITKIGWFDSYKDEFVFRNVVTDISKFLGGSVEHFIIGVQLLSELTNEINQITESDANRSLTRHRKIASSFRDLQLFEIFQLSCNLLKSTSENCKRGSFEDENRQEAITQLLKLAYNCLTFDFIGTSADESSDDLCTVQIPTNWRSVFLDPSTLDLFFGLYHSMPPSVSSLSLSCLVQIASVRRSLFNFSDRAKFLAQLMNGVRNILINPIGLSDPSNYHEFCRLLSRLKANYQLGELVVVEGYAEIIELIAKFTVESLQMWQFAPNSVHYLLSLWQRMVASVPYVKFNELHFLERYTPEITKAYLTSRLESVAVIIRDNLEDPLDDFSMVHQQLEQLSLIGRCDYQKTCALLINYFDQSANAYQELISKCTPGDSSSSVEICIQEGRLAWLVYIIGAEILGRGSYNNQDDNDTMDGELICRVLQLMNLTDSRLAQSGCEKLELAMLSFFDNFRKVYVGEQVQRNSKVYQTFSDILGLSEESSVLSVFVRKIITNLKYWGRCEKIINKTLQLLNDLSMGYSCVRKLVKLDEVEFLLNNHNSEHFPFLGNTITVQEMRSRSTFYTSLGRLLLIELGEDDNKFENFMIPLAAAFEKVALSINNSSDSSVFPSEDTKMTLVGLARDIRGFAYSLNTKPAFMMFFDWIYPNYMQILLRAIEIWYYDPQVTTPILKFFNELVQNRSQRLQFDVSSPNGILMFREISKMICTYGGRIINVEIPKNQIYHMKLKGYSTCFSILKAALCGSYVNFGVFRLYGDDCLDNSLNMFIRLLLSIPKSDLLHYPKLSQTYYILLECLAQDHMSFLSKLEPQVFLYILSSISDGLMALDTLICTGCCATLDHIVTYLFKLVQLKVDVLSGKKPQSVMPQSAEIFLKVLEANSEILQQLLKTVLNVIIFEDCRNQWSMSRPLLGLILLNEDYFKKMSQGIIQNQPAERRVMMSQWFDSLMDGIERNLLTKNRDKFTHNLSRFRQEINDTIKNSNESTAASIQDMMTIS